MSIWGDVHQDCSQIGRIAGAFDQSQLFQPPDRDPVQTEIDQYGPDSSLLRRITPQTDETRERLRQIDPDAVPENK